MEMSKEKMDTDFRVHRIKVKIRSLAWSYFCVLGNEFYGSISVSGQLPTYPSPNPTTVNQ